jgi:hypothetical protein
MYQVGAGGQYAGSQMTLFHFFSDPGETQIAKKRVDYLFQTSMLIMFCP